MAVTKAGFSERIFEFAFNAEFCHKYKTVLAACPYIPTQQQEKSLGYDVEFKLKQGGGAISSVFLQHKVSRYVDQETGSNKKFFDKANGPYFAFELDNDQYNLIHSASLNLQKQIYYCAPVFASRLEIEKQFMNKSVVNLSRWFNISKATSITDTKSHSIIYDATGNSAWKFSDNPELIDSFFPGNNLDDLFSPFVKFDQESVGEMYQQLRRHLVEWWDNREKYRIKSAESGSEINRRQKNLPPERQIENLGDAIDAVSEVVAEYYGLSWLIAVKNN